MGAHTTDDPLVDVHPLHLASYIEATTSRDAKFYLAATSNMFTWVSGAWED